MNIGCVCIGDGVRHLRWGKESRGVRKHRDE